MASSAEQPRIWLVIGDKLGDNAQARAIVDALELPYSVRRLVPRPAFEQGKPRFRASLDHLDPTRSDTLEPPWPDLIVTVGRRHAMAALWVKRQHPQTRIVLLGRPRRWMERFDLIVLPPQYRVPAAANLLQLKLPLHRVDRDAVKAAAAARREEFAGLARPVTAVLIGGPTQPFRFDASVARTLLANCRQLQHRLGGTLYLSTSRRTPAVVCDTLEQGLPETAILHRWSEGGADNPYLALLDQADYFLVTGDSVSMLMEVADCGKPLAILPLPVRPTGRLWQHITRALHGHTLGRLGQLLYRSGLIGYTRDLRRIHEHLISGGHAVMAGQAFRPPAGPLPDEKARVRSAVLSLLSKQD